MHQKKYNGKSYDLQWIEERLLSLGFHLVFCYRDPDSFYQAREKRLEVSGNPSQYDDLSIFIEEQEMFSEIIAHTILPKITLDVTGKDIDELSHIIADWLEKSGGLYTP